MPPTSAPRVLVLPASGTLLVSTDLHGNGKDFRRLRVLFLEERDRQPATHWAILGDLVHGPSPEARARGTDHYDFDDESWPIVRDVLALRQAFPDHVHLVLGNHDHAHVGGRRTHKFYPDEAAHLESTLQPEERAALHRLFRNALLAIVAPGGLLLAHGSPGDELRALRDLDGIALPHGPGDGYGSVLLESFLESYGQRQEVTQRLLQTVSRDGPPVHLVVHGHDRDESGYFTEHGNQVCPVLFGAPDANKRYLRLDLSACYRHVEELREGQEVRRLYG